MGIEANIESPQALMGDLSDRALLMMALSELSALRKENASLAHKVGEMAVAMDDMLEMIEEDTLDTLIVLVFKQMERMRIEEPALYAVYLKRGRFFAETNRKQLRTMNAEYSKANSLNTISKALEKAREAGIIIDTHHTSRTVKQVSDERGRPTKIITMRHGGRGNFRLFIDPSLLVPKAVLSLKNEKSQNADNQPFEAIKNQKVVQSNNDYRETLKRKDNNCGTVEITDLAIAKPDKSSPQPIGCGNVSGNERGMSHLSHICKKIEGKIPPVRHLSKEESAAELSRWKAKGGKRGENRRARLRTDEQVRNSLPEKELDRMAAYCWLLCKEMIWPHFDQQYLQSITLHAISLLKLHLHLLRLDMPLEDAYNLVSYAIQRQAEQLAKGGYCYAPMQFLNPELEYKGGTLRHVIDVWLIEGEFKRLEARNMRYEKQVRWCYAYGHSHKVFKLFTKDLEAHGYSLVTSRLLSGYYDNLLQKYFNKNGIGEKAQATIRKKFSDRVSAKVVGIKKLAAASGKDDVMVVFEGWRKGQKK